MHVMILHCTPEASERAIVAAGGRTKEDFFSSALKSRDKSVETFTLKSADGEKLPQGMALTDFDGVVITGSPLSTYEDTPVVRSQIDLARDIFEAGIPSFGSCYGLQLMTTALGGSVHLNPKGREIGIARNIMLNDAGRAHAMYRGKAPAFSAFCSHQDEVSALPEGSTLLASNAVSDVQAAEITRGEKSFWGVQYHPEFDFEMIAILIDRQPERHIKEGLARSPEDVKAIVADYHALNAGASRADLAWRYGLQDDVLADEVRQAEFGNWLASKVKPYAAGRR